MKNRRFKHKNITLVLNSDYLPINVTSLNKAFKLVYKGKAEIVESEGEINNKHKRPSIIRLYKYVNLPYRKLVLSKDNIFRRDEHSCVYCGGSSNLTIDHIIPKSKGGLNTWENLATCCFRCNAYKKDKTLEESNMTLLIKPIKPNPTYFLYRSYKTIEKWQPYIFNN